MSAFRKVALSEVAEIERDSIAASAIQDGTLYVGLENIQSGGDFLNVREVDGGELASSKFSFTAEHLLYGKLRPYLAKIARPNFAGICSTDILPVLPGPKLSRDYLAHFLLQTKMVDLANSRASGANLPRLSPRALAEFEVPLPPLPEQRRIAAILDQAETLRTQRRAALAQLDSLTQSIFLDMFGDPVMNPKQWPQVRLGEHTFKMGSGSTPTGGDAAYKASGVSLIRSLNVRDGDFAYKNLAFIDEPQAAKLANVQVAENDVLLNITGASVARVCRAPKAVLPARVNQHVMIIRPKTTLDCVFLERMLLSVDMKRKLLQIGGSGATREAITKAQAEELAVICPPLHLQQTFATRIQAIAALKATHRAALAELDALFASLQQRAFAGEM